MERVGQHPLFIANRCIYTKYSQRDYNTIIKMRAIPFTEKHGVGAFVSIYHVQKNK
jgi:hypothetical protein